MKTLNENLAWRHFYFVDFTQLRPFYLQWLRFCRRIDHYSSLKMLHFITAIVMILHCPAPDFNADLGYWQRALSLQDWQVSVKLVRAGELDSGTLGDIDIAVEDKTAAIRILQEQDSDLPKRLARADQRLTVVHELVHLKRMVEGATWRNEAATVAETTELVRSHHRWREAAAIERAL